MDVGDHGNVAGRHVESISVGGVVVHNIGGTLVRAGFVSWFFLGQSTVFFIVGLIVGRKVHAGCV